MRKNYSYLNALNMAVAEAMATDERVYLLGEDILDPYGGAFRVTAGLSTRFPERVIGTPISEACITGIGVGMAVRGLLPVIEIMFGDFLPIASDQIVNHAAKFRQMYKDKVSVPMVIRTPMGGGRGYGPTHSQSLEKMFLGTPGLNVVSPSIFHDVKGMFCFAILEDKDPTLFIEHKLLYPLQLQFGDDELCVEYIASTAGYPIASVKNFNHGATDITVISYGGTSRILDEVMREMKNEEIRINAFFPSLISGGIDRCIVESVKASQKVIIIEEGAGFFGWSAEMASQVYEKAGTNLKKPVRRIQASDSIIPASRELEHMILPNRVCIERAIEEILS